MNVSWEEFKEDVSLKQFMNAIDRSIKRRNCLYIGETD